MADENKWYVTVKGDGSYSPSSGGTLKGGPNEISEEVAREISEAGLDWIIVGRKPVSLTESALRGPLTLEDIFPAKGEAEAAQNEAAAERAKAPQELLDHEGGEPAPLTAGPEPESDNDPLPSSEAEAAAKAAGADAPDAPAEPDAEPEYTCPHEDCEKHGYAYASEASLERHLETKHGEES